MLGRRAFRSRGVQPTAYRGRSLKLDLVFVASGLLEPSDGRLAFHGVRPRLAVSSTHMRATSRSCGSRSAAEQSASAIGPIVRRLTPSSSLTRCCEQ